LWSRSPISATAELLLNLTVKTALKAVDFYHKVGSFLWLTV